MSNEEVKMTRSLSVEEALDVSEAFLLTLYGKDLFSRWSDCKLRLGFVNEKGFVRWLLDYLDSALTTEQEEVDEEGVKCEEGESVGVLEEGVMEDAEDDMVRVGENGQGQEGYDWLPASSAGGIGVEGGANVNLPIYSQQPQEVNTTMLDAGQLVKKHAEMRHQEVVDPGAPCIGGGILPGEARTSTFSTDSTCSECGLRANSHRELHKHYRDVHAGMKPYSCEECGRSFTEPGNLKYHVRCVHEKIRAFECPSCGYRAARRSDLAKHQRTHTGEKPYSCSRCGKSFTQQSSLYNHLRAVHKLPAAHAVAGDDVDMQQTIHPLQPDISDIHSAAAINEHEAQAHLVAAMHDHDTQAVFTNNETAGMYS